MRFDPAAQRSFADACLLAPSRDRIHRRRRKIGIGPLPFPVGLARRNEQRARAIAVRPFDMSDLDRHQLGPARPGVIGHAQQGGVPQARSEEHTSELQSLMRISYAVFCLKKKKTKLELLILHIQLQITVTTTTL